MMRNDYDARRAAKRPLVKGGRSGNDARCLESSRISRVSRRLSRPG